MLDQHVQVISHGPPRQLQRARDELRSHVPVLVDDRQYALLSVRELHHRALDIEFGDQGLLLRSERSQEEAEASTNGVGAETSAIRDSDYAPA